VNNQEFQCDQIQYENIPVSELDTNNIGENVSDNNLDVDNDKENGKKINACEMWIWRKMQRISWMEKKTNESVRMEIGIEEYYGWRRRLMKVYAWRLE